MDERERPDKPDTPNQPPDIGTKARGSLADILKKQWLGRQDWHQQLTQRAVEGAGMLERMQREAQSPLQLRGQIGKSNLLEGYGTASYEMPIDDMQSLMLLMGGSGVRGTVQTPRGPHKLNEFLPEVGVRYRRAF